MMEKFKIPRVKQCAKCPWKKSTDPFQIPDGYDPQKHAALADTIADGPADFTKRPAMSCHHSNGSDGMYCVGWLVNQLGPGNNIPLRIKMRNCINVNELQVFGLQHQIFANTLPKLKS